MRTSWLLLASALLSSGCIVEAPTAGTKSPSPPERSRAAVRDAPPLQTKLGANIDGKVEIVSASVQPGQVPMGEQAKVTLVFKALEQLETDYTVFVHVEDVDGRVERVNRDHRPMNGEYPTTQWKKGELVKDEFLVFVPPVPVRALNVWAGLWEPKTDTRLRLQNPDQVRNDGNNRVLVLQIPVLQ